MPSETKLCLGCGQVKERVDGFGPYRPGKGTPAQCKTCETARKRKYKQSRILTPEQIRKIKDDRSDRWVSSGNSAAAKEKYAANRDAILQKNRETKYNLGAGGLVRWLEAQDYRCAVCSESLDADTANVDHDHGCCPGDGSCGRCVRGLLCRQCNHGFGNFRDSAELLTNGIAYLEAYHSRGR